MMHIRASGHAGGTHGRTSPQSGMDSRTQDRELLHRAERHVLFGP
jgi:hypothetical protein